MTDVIVIDDILPSVTQDRFLNYVSSPDFKWSDYNHVQSAGMYFNNFVFDSSKVNIKEIDSSSLITAVYHNNFKQEKIYEETVFWLGIAILDEYSKRTNKKITDIMRMKVNNLSQSIFQEYDANTCNKIHVDNFENGTKTLVYYINDSDGDTFLFDLLQPLKGEYLFDEVSRVSPKKGRIVVFDTLRLHAPSNPIYYPRRYILNINFIEEEIW